MNRPVTLFTGQWADMPLATLVEKAAQWGYDGLELACWGDHFEVEKALDSDRYLKEKRDLLEKHGLECFVVSTHLVGQCVCDYPINEIHRRILPDRIWGDGDPDGVHQRAAEEIKNTARVAAKFNVKTVVGFTGSSIWHLLAGFPPVPPEVIEAGYRDFADRWKPILDVFKEVGVTFALEVHPTEIAYDYWTAKETLKAIANHPAFSFNFDPSHLYWQGVDPVRFVMDFADSISHVHVKESYVNLNGQNGIISSHLPFGDLRRGWDFVSPGRGGIPFERIFRALTAIGYKGPLSIEWEDTGMDREHGAVEALEFVRKTDFESSQVAFDNAFAS